MIQRENFTSAPGSSSEIAGLLAKLPDRGDAMRLVAVALMRVDRSAGKHPYATHEARLRRAPDEQHLELLAAAAQQDHGRGLARGRGWAGVVLLAWARALALLRCAHRLTLPAANLWRMNDTTASSPEGQAPRA